MLETLASSHISNAIGLDRDDKRERDVDGIVTSSVVITY